MHYSKEHPYTVFIPYLPVNTRAPSKARSQHARRLREYMPLSNELLGTNVEVKIVFMFKSGNATDIDNMLKLPIDALKGSIIKDDAQVKTLVASISNNSFVTGTLMIVSPTEGDF